MSKKILLIEDEVFIKELYQRVLSQAGFIVLSATDGQAGLELIRAESKSKQKPDLILLDIMLPKINGIEVLKRLKNDDITKDIPIILLTNLGQENIIKEAFKIGVQGYMIKIHLTPYQVVSHIKEFLENPKLILDPEQLSHF